MPQIRILKARPQRLLDPMISIARELNQKQEHTIVLVPEQMTLMMEKLLMKRLPARTLFHLNVVSPTRLYSLLLSKTGRGDEEPLSEIGCRIAISQALENMAENLPYYKSTLRHPGFLGNLSALMKDLKRGSITPDQLSEAANETDDLLVKSKLNDLSSIYRKYEELLSCRFSDNEDRLTYAARLLNHTHVLSGEHVLVYGFDTLPEQMLNLLAAIGAQAAGLTIFLICDDASAPDGILYDPIRLGISRFEALLNAKGLRWKEEQLPNKELDAIEPIRYLERALFSTKYVSYPKLADGITVFRALTPMKEAERMSRHILALLEDGTPLNQIAVFYPDNRGYEFAVSAALKDAGIPALISNPLNAVSHGLPLFLLHALEVMDKGWKTPDLIALLQTGYCPASREECAELINYAYSFGIEGKAWLLPFVRGYSSAQTSRCEEIRQKVISPLVNCRSALVEAKNARESVSAIWSLLDAVSAYETLQNEQKNLVANGFDVRASQAGQIWSIVQQLLNEMVRISESKRIPLKHFANRMRAGFEAVKIQTLPEKETAVSTGVLGHMIVEEADAVFILGMNQGLLIRETDSLLLPDERSFAEKQTGSYLGVSDESKTLLAQLDLKRAMTLPKSALFLSCSANGSNGGEALEELPLLKMISTHYFQALPQERNPLPYSTQQLLKGLPEFTAYLAEHSDPLLSSQLSAALNSHEGKRFLITLNTALSKTSSAISPVTAKKLYGDSALSVSRLETYAKCPFRFFLENGVRAEILHEWKPDKQMSGTFSHDCLNAFAQAALRNPGFPNIPEETLNLLTEEAISPEIRKALAESPFGDGNRNLQRLQRAEIAVRTAAARLTAQLAKGKFSLHSTEITFGPHGQFPPIRLKLEDGSDIFLQGRIDRVDRCMDQWDHYFRVIDYKSSKKKLTPEEIQLGTQLQLPLYLSVCKELFSTEIGAGAYYFYVGDPTVKTDSDAPEAVEKALSDCFHLNGVTLSDPKVVSLSDLDGDGALAGFVGKDGNLLTSANPLTSAEMEKLVDYAVHKAEDIADLMFSGEISAFPVSTNEKLSCEYCDHREACPFDKETDAVHKGKACTFKELVEQDRLPDEATSGEESEKR